MRDLHERCILCNRMAYTVHWDGEDTISGFVCCYCIKMYFEEAYK